MINFKDKLFAKPPKNGKFYVIAIDGRGGSGKPALAGYISSLLPDFLYINGDDYFEPTPNAIAWGDFNDKRFEEDVIEPLRDGRNTLVYRPYNWRSKPHISEKKMTVGKGVCIERCYSFEFDLDWDLKIWVETTSDISFKRGLERDKMPIEQATRAWKEVWQPREDRYIELIKPAQIADINIDGTMPFQEQLA